MVLTTNLSSYYNLNGNATDSTGTYNGVVTGATVSALGIESSCYNFSGVSYITIGNQPIGTSAFTMSAWIKSSDSSTFKVICSYHDGTNITMGLWYAWDVTNKVYFNITDGGGNDQLGTTGATVNDNKWHHIVATRGTGGINIYVDGVLKGGPITNNNRNVSFVTGIKIAVRSDNLSGNFIGLIDEVGLWSRELSAAEVVTLFNAGVGLTYPFSYVGNITTSFGLSTSVLQSNTIAKDTTKTFTKYQITGTFTGSIQAQITANGDYATPTYDTVTLTSGVGAIGTFSVPGNCIKYKMLSTDGVLSAPLLIQYS